MATPTGSPVSRTLAAAFLAIVLVGCAGESEPVADTIAATDPPAAGVTAEDMDDRVERALDTDSTLSVFGLDADDDDGRIILKGRVRTAEQKALALQVATREAGGIAVENEIRVDATISADRARPIDNDELEERIEDAIEADTTFRGADIDVEEDNGQLILEGRVGTAALKAAAEAKAKGMAGSVVVVNRLRVEQE